MLGTLLLAQFAQVESPERINPGNTLPSPNNASERWPGAGQSPFRWTFFPPPDKVPFVIVNSPTEATSQIAIRWATSPSPAQGEPTHYVAMRQTNERLEEADSRECHFGDLMQDLRELPLPETIIPGTTPHQQWSTPQFQRGVETITLMNSRQSDGQNAVVTLTASHGIFSDWVKELFDATRDCWKPMAAPTPP